MSDLKPIEAGCMALIISGPKLGVKVLIGTYFAESTRYPGKDFWTIIESSCGYKYIEGAKTLLMYESRMINIDDPDLKEEPKTVEIELIGDLMEEAISNLNALIK